MNPTASSEPGTAAGLGAGEVAVSEMDVSCRLPLLVLLMSAAVWLVIASGFALISSIKFHSPVFLAGPAWLTYGRVHPAASSAFLYGFCLQSGLGVSLWLLARLGRTRLAQRWLVTVGAMFWNLGVTVGVLGVLAGDRTGFQALELPGYATPMVFTGYVLLGVSGALTFHQRREQRLYVSQWFLFAALFWFPWIYSTAQLLLVTFPARGVAQSVIAWWYADNLQFVWLWLAGLGVVFYLAPKLTSRELQNRNLALFAFWIILLFGSWGGIPNSAPVPAWMPALSTVGTVLTTLALLAVGLSVWKTARGGGPAPGVRPQSEASRQVGISVAQDVQEGQTLPEPKRCRAPLATALQSGAREHLPLRFVRFGALAFLVAGFMRVLGSFPPVSNVTDLTWFGPATDQFNAYGFFAMVNFGAAYWILPQVMGLEFPWPRLARAHFWLASVGIVLLAAPLAVAGVSEGLKLRSPDHAFMEVVKATLPCLRLSTVGDLLMAVGHVAFLANLAGLAARFYLVRVASVVSSLTLDMFKPAGAKP
jgi:cytochrome c oxidase cbb3-type subunit 1